MTRSELIVLRLRGIEPVCFNCKKNYIHPTLPECWRRMESPYHKGEHWEDPCPRFILEENLPREEGFGND